MIASYTGGVSNANGQQYDFNMNNASFDNATPQNQNRPQIPGGESYSNYHNQNYNQSGYLNSNSEDPGGLASEDNFLRK